MQEQRIRAQSGVAVQRWLATSREQIEDQLAAFATDFVERMVANWALLLKRDDVAAFRARVHELDAEYAPSGLRLQEAGAWPPYSFTPALTVSQPTVE
jgi:hypothetical protein